MSLFTRAVGLTRAVPSFGASRLYSTTLTQTTRLNPTTVPPLVSKPNYTTFNTTLMPRGVYGLLTSLTQSIRNFGCKVSSTAGSKTKKAVMKRFRVTGKGSLKMWKCGHKHNTGYLSRNRKNRLATSGGIKEGQIEKNVKRMMKLG
jgi:ribosomal protein L35